jgi:hypothetical protein
LENEITGGQIVFNAFEKMIRNRGQGFKLKPVLGPDQKLLDH